MNAAKTTARLKFEKYGNRENRKPTKCCSDLNRGRLDFLKTQQDGEESCGRNI